MLPLLVQCDGLPRLGWEMRNSFGMRREIVVIVLIVSFAANASVYCQDGMLEKLEEQGGGEVVNLKKFKLIKGHISDWGRSEIQQHLF